MKYIVARAFNTPARRFAIGQEVFSEEVDGDVPVEERVRLGFLVDPAGAHPEPPVMKQPKAKPVADTAAP